MSSQEEGDYVDMSGLVLPIFLYILNKNTLLRLFDDCTCVTCYFLELFYF